MTSSIRHRLQKIEAGRPPPAAPSHMIDFLELDLDVAAMWLAVDLDINRLDLEQLSILKHELRRHL